MVRSCWSMKSLSAPHNLVARVLAPQNGVTAVRTCASRPGTERPLARSASEEVP
jgi:hypothetical protein